MRIGEVADRLGVAVHVLRHWDAESVVVPDRTASGHREYTDEDMRRLQVLRACQGIGMSLQQIRLVLHRHSPSRTEVLTEQLHRIRTQRQHLEASERFLTHVITCEHDLLTRCDECSAYADLGAQHSFRAEKKY